MIKLKVFIVRIISMPWLGRLIARIFRNNIPVNGLIIETNSPYIHSKTKAYLFWGLYESAEASFVNTYLRPDLDVVELGASLGYISCLIRRKLLPQKKLISIEANPNLLPIIKKNLQVNVPDLPVSIYNYAIDYKNQEAILQLGEFSSGSKIVDLAQPSVGKIQVPAITLGELCAKESLSDFALVSDIEGAEGWIVTQDQNILRNCKQIIIELHPTEMEHKLISIEAMLNKFINNGYKVRDEHGPVYVFER